MLKFPVFLFVLIHGIFVAEGAINLEPYEVACFKCICNAASACNDIFECAKKTMNMEYWSFAGETIAGGEENRGKNQEDNYNNCIKDETCILHTMYHYTNAILQRLGGDVNCDGLSVCADKFAAHVFGLQASRPDKTFSIGLSKRFDRCMGRGIKKVINWAPNCDNSNRES